MSKLSNEELAETEINLLKKLKARVSRKEIIDEVDEFVRSKMEV